MTVGPAARRSRTGFGLDTHRFGDTPPVILGGVVVAEDRGVEATSDGDVLTHAVIDALLGACVLGDIGEHFPSDDPSNEGADSMKLLRQVVSLASDEGWVPAHVDATVVAEDVRVSPKRDEIRANLADALGIDIAAVSVKATTTDGLGFLGVSEGLAAMAMMTVEARS